MHDVEFINLVLYVTLTLTNLYNRFVLMHDLTHNPPFTPKTGFVPKIRLLWESVPNLQSLAQPRTAQPQHVLIDYFAQTQNKNQKLALLNDQTPFISKIKQIIWKNPYFKFITYNPVCIKASDNSYSKSHSDNYRLYLFQILPAISS